jgi:hypothetical protein
MIAAPHGAAPHGAAPPVSAFRARRAKHKPMKPKKKQAPSTHGPSAITEGAQQPRLEDPSREEPSSESGRPGIAAQVEGEFNADLWRDQAMEDKSVDSNQLFLLFILSYKFNNEGKCLLNSSLDEIKVKFSKELATKNFALLESRGWFKSSIIESNTEYIALKGRVKV